MLQVPSKLPRRLAGSTPKGANPISKGAESRKGIATNAARPSGPTSPSAREDISDARRWFREGTAAIYPSGVCPWLFFCGCVVASGPLAHGFVSIARWWGSASALSLLLAFAWIAWCPVYVLAAWDDENPKASLVGAALRASFILLVAVTAAAFGLAQVPAQLAAESLQNLLSGWPGSVIQMTLTFLFATVLHRHTVPAFLVGLDELGLLDVPLEGSVGRNVEPIPNHQGVSHAHALLEKNRSPARIPNPGRRFEG